MDERFRLKDAFKTVKADQDKTVRPEETVRAIRERLSASRMRIMDEVVRIDSGRLDIPVYMSHYGPDARAVTGSRKQMGKGATPAQAEASAVMELAERFSVFSFRANPDEYVTASQADLKDRAMPFDRIAESVHDQTEYLPQVRRLFAALPMRWCRGRNLTLDAPVMIPFDWFYTINEFNGSSAGNCPEEALCQGICEVVERHVSARVSRERIRVPAIDPRSIDDACVQEMLAKYQRAGVRIHLSDFSLDSGVPSVGVVAWDPATFPEKSEIVWTAGTAPDPRKAAGRALSEAAQLGGDFESGARYLASGLPKPERIAAVDFLMEGDAVIPLSRLPQIADDNIRVEVERLIAAMAARRMEIFSIDVTHPDLMVPAFYTLIPGAQFRERAAGGSVGMFCARMITEQRPPDQALAWLESARRLLPDLYYIQFYIGYTHLALQSHDLAVDHLTHALDLSPASEDLPSIYVYLGTCYKEMGRYADALANLKQGLAWDKDRADIHNLMGFCHFKLKEHEAAIACFEEVLRLNPGSAIDYANIASNYRDMGQTANAMAYYETALSIDPGIDFARENLKRLRTISHGL